MEEENNYYDDYDNYGNYNDENYENYYDSQMTDAIVNENDALGVVRTTSYMVLKNDDIKQVRETLIQKTMDHCSLTREDATLLMIFFKWNIDLIYSDYFDNIDKYQEKAGVIHSKESLDELKKNKAVSNNKECLACYSSEDDFTQFASLNCKHNLCFDCWEGFITSKLDEPRTFLSTTCPQIGCNLIIPEDFFFKHCAKADVVRIDQAILKNFTDSNTECKWCPSPGCESIIKSDARTNKEIDCICGYNFCFKCLKYGHRPCPCEMIEGWEKKNNDESENVKWLTVNTKQCPKCKKYIEKNQGCDHMTCRTSAGGCGHEFCWICFQDWKSHQACNKFDEKTKSEIEKNKQTIKLEIEKYAFYFDRWSNNKKSLEHAVRMRNSIEYQIHLFNALKNVPFPDLTFLRDGVETVIKSRRLLMNSYTFGFYLKDCKEKQVFEHHQSLVEQYANKIHDLLENETMQNIMALVDYDDFQSEFMLFRNSIIDGYTATNKFLGNLVESIENTMLPLINYKLLK